ncbi:MAG: crotonase/enoyl-CoA hydratase family protein [Sandaracinus sp.]|nr:crotonase/enoyl-CoA hydratase family protein [Sandaracinus sp.]MCB9614451.1 crotonase/enoyl-CoA hydratase family protein [Sandaracinus sp.]MCB9618593.1 crotonase/enoyl-CoA hydratase family protein [Sandaracinus sp.]MCB9622154.1 crotonase/enoyl-CoA hydratase family protein [Sandaracinus sp.]MCB9630554.1 crotonase/enoyl-CoA hydratase family protein [Sandaracinus sp.]
MSERVTLEIVDHVAHVRLNRPEKRNGLDPALFQALVDAGRRVRDMPEVRAVVLAGEGPAFCAGLDFQAFLQTPNAKELLLARPADRPANLAQEVAWIWREVPVPVIAAIHGACFGGGLQIALGADLRYGAPDARFSVMEIEYGLVPDMSGSITLLEILPLDVAKELTFTGRIVDGNEAKSLGLLTRVVDDPLAAATEAAKAIAARSPDAIRGSKKLLDEAGRLSVREAFELESELQVGLLGSPNQVEAVMARLQKRPATFRDPVPPSDAS